MTALSPRPSRVLGGDAAVFATPDRDLAIASLQPWTDADFEQGYVNGAPYMRERRPGAFGEIYGKKPGSLYSLPEDGFAPDDRLMHTERINHDEVPILHRDDFPDALEALRQTRFTLHPYEQGGDHGRTDGDQAAAVPGGSPGGDQGPPGDPAQDDGLDPDYDHPGVGRVEKRGHLLPGVELQPHQREVADTGKGREARMLLYHSLGSGKSLSSLAGIESAGDPFTAVTPASLRPNFEKERTKFTDRETPGKVVSYNAVAKGGVEPSPTMVFDEAQRLRNPDSAQTREAIRLARKAKHLYLLSGSPIVNHPHDLAPLIEMLAGKHYDPAEFDREFIDERKISPGFGGWLKGVQPVVRPELKNERELKDLLAGHVHYHAPVASPVDRTEERHVVEMGPEQTKLYKGFWNQLPLVFRWKLQHDFPLSKHELSRLSSFLSGPRQVGLSTYPFMKDKADPAAAYAQSPKLQKAVGLMREALERDKTAKGIAYSNFVGAGLTPYGAGLEQAGIPYGVFHGGLNDAERKRVVDDYNVGRTRVLLYGPSGSEGLSLKGTRLLQVLDPHWNRQRTDQAIGRGVRFDSHLDLPLADRNVRVQHFVSKMPRSFLARAWRALVGQRDDDARKSPPGVDTYLEQMGEKKEDLNEQFLAVLREVGSEKRAEEDAESAFEDEEGYAPCLICVRRTTRITIVPAGAARDADDESDEPPFTVAVDLDGTLAEKQHPFDPETIGDPRPGARKWLRKFRDAGARVIIFTVRGDTGLVAGWLDDNDIPYDHINENPDQPEDGSGKVLADVYWDDRAVRADDLDESGPEILDMVYEKRGEDALRVHARDILEMLQ